MEKLSNLTINICNDGKCQLYTEDFLRQYAKDNKDYLLHTKSNAIIVSNYNGWCTLVNQFGHVYQAWAGEISLA